MKAVVETEARCDAVDETGDVRFQSGHHRVRLRLRQPASRYGRIELLLRRIDERLYEPIDGLPLRLGDGGQRLAALELCSQLGLGQAEVARGGIESAERPAVVEAGPGATEQRQVTGLDALLELGALRLRKATRR